MRMLVPAIAGTLFVLVTSTASVQAQATRTWVSGVGSDDNPCSRTAPCKTFAGTLIKTAASGIINCLDPGGWGAVTITKSVTIDCTGMTGSVLATLGSSGIIVNGSGISVILRGLAIDGAGSGGTGINFINGSSLQIQDTTVRGFSNAMFFIAPNGVTASLTIRNSSMSNNGGGSVNISTTGTGKAKVTIEDSQFDNNNAGVYAAASAGGSARVSIKNSSMSGNAFYGVGADSGGGPAQILIDNSVMSNNGSYGVLSSGANATVFVCCSAVAGNDTGLGATGGAGLGTYGNNNVNMNTTANLVGTFPAVQQ